MGYPLLDDIYHTGKDASDCNLNPEDSAMDTLHVPRPQLRSQPPTMHLPLCWAQWCTPTLQHFHPRLLTHILLWLSTHLNGFLLQFLLLSPLPSFTSTPITVSYMSSMTMSLESLLCIWTEEKSPRASPCPGHLSRCMFPFSRVQACTEQDWHQHCTQILAGLTCQLWGLTMQTLMCCRPWSSTMWTLMRCPHWGKATLVHHFHWGQVTWLPKVHVLMSMGPQKSSTSSVLWRCHLYGHHVLTPPFSGISKIA